jgi:hypothetical protein
MSGLKLIACTLVVVGLLAACGCSQEGGIAYRWLFVMRSMRSSEALERTIALLPRAKAAGYNAIVLSDGNLMRLDRVDESYRKNVLRLQQEARKQGLDLIPCVMPIGYSSALLDYDLNLAEGLPVKDALFVAHGGTATVAADPPVSLPGGGFEQASDNVFTGWDMQDFPGKSTFVDRQVSHSGGSSVRMEGIAQADPRYGHCRFMKVVKVSPFRQYHVSAWIKTEDFEDPGTITLLALAPTEGERSLGDVKPEVKRTQDWTQYHLSFNSLNWNEVRIYFGSWGGKGGRLWWDDVSLEETGLVNIVRRAGCPISVRSEKGTVYEEGRDFEPLRDPNLAPWENYHQPPVLRLTQRALARSDAPPGRGTRISEGERLRVSYYHSIAIGDGQVMVCLSEPKVYDLLREEIRLVNELLHPAAFFMQHDEIRAANWDEACQKRGLTPGKMLADNLRQCRKIIRDLRPDAQIWVWSDMFDPMHNAHDNYYLVNGTWAGSWEGLSPDIGIVNWAGHLNGKNCQFFADRKERQVLAGYYDGDEDGSGIAEWLKSAHGVPGVVGAMYTTWQDKYGAMEAWAKKAWGGAKPE